MAVDSFIPELWTAELLTTLEANYVLAGPGAVNRDYEGEIANYGDTVHIGSIGDPTVSNYVKNVTVISPQTLTTTDQSLLIDQAKYFAFEVDDVDGRQARDGGKLLTTANTRAAVKMQEIADTYVGTLMVSGAGKILDPMDVTAPGAAYVTLVRLRTALDRANVPQLGRWVAVSPEFHAMLTLDPRFTDAGAAGSANALTNGVVGRAAGFEIRVSSNLPAGTVGSAGEVSSFIIAGHSLATTFADQISKTEAYRPQDSFSDAIKGLHLYGAKVIRPEGLAVIDVDVTLPTS
jgi:hypothetical protein